VISYVNLLYLISYIVSYLLYYITYNNHNVTNIIFNFVGSIAFLKIVSIHVGYIIGSSISSHWLLLIVSEKDGCDWLLIIGDTESVE